MTETTETLLTREELEAELASLRAKQSAVEKVGPDLSTRDRSPVKPQDHKPAETENVTIELEGVKFTTTRQRFGSLRVLDKLEHNQIMSALRLLVGDASVDQYLDANPDADVEDAGKLLEALGKAVGAGN